MSGFFNPAAAKMSTTSSRRDGARNDLPDGGVHFLGDFRFSPLALGEGGPHGLEEAHVVANLNRLVVRHGKRKRLRQIA